MKAQASIEYLMITAFLLSIVLIIFVLALFYYESNAKMAMAGNSLDSIVKTADLVYAKGYGTVLYTTTSWPNGVQQISILHKCKENSAAPGGLLGCQGGEGPDCYCDKLVPGCECANNWDCIKYSAAQLDMDDGTQFLYGSKAKLCIRYEDVPGHWNCDSSVPADAFPLGPVKITVKVLWFTAIIEGETVRYIALQETGD